MKDNKSSIVSIDEYIAGFPSEVQIKLKELRTCISKAAPEATERINYGIPTFTLHGNLVHFAGFKKHIGFYPAPSGIEAFRNELKTYESSKGAVQFPLDQPIPFKLIEKIVQFRVVENKEISIRKKQKRKCKYGHTYYKSSDCPTCPICEAERKPEDNFLSELVAPARRALENAGILTVQQLAGHTQKSIMDLHGMGPGSLPALNKALDGAGLSFKKN